MSTAEELTTLTLDFLAEHTNEAVAAVVLGVFWHLIWERPKHLNKIAKDAYDEPAINDIKQRDTQLRGNLKKELQHVLNENEDLERIVQELRSKLEGGEYPQIDSFGYSPTQAYVPIGTHHSARKRNRSGGLIRAAIGLTTNEIDALSSCWALLVFSFCLLAKRRTRKRYNPLSTTVVTLEKGRSWATEYFQAEVLPALIKIWIYLSSEFQKLHARVTDPESISGKAIAAAQKSFHSHTESTIRSMKEVFNDKILPVSARLTQQGVEYGHSAVKFISAMEMPKWKEQPPSILLSEHDKNVGALETSLKETEARNKALEEKISSYEKALKGKEILLYEERMKTRSAKLEAAKVTIEREESRRKESKDTEASARADVAEDQRRILRNFLSEHIQSRQQQDFIRKIEEKNAPKKSKIVLPDPILQGFASAMYLNNISDLSSENATQSDLRNQVVAVGDLAMECRDDACNEDECYGNVNETRLLEIKEQYMRSKTAVGSLRPSQVDPRDGYKASTGSLLWNAANEATKAKDCTTKNPYTTRAASQEPSSWMEDPASIMCDWRMNGNEEELRE